MRWHCKLPFAPLPLVALLALLAGCPRPQHPGAPPGGAVPGPAAPPAAPPAAAPGAAAAGTPYDVIAADSLLVVLVYRGGKLASFGHNHVIASHDLGGTFRVPADGARTAFELRVPVATLTVDEPTLRAAEDAAAFPPEVPASARDGTREHMLGESLLDAAKYPEIVLRGAGVTADGAGNVVTQVEATVRGTVHPFTATVHCRLADGVLDADGELPLKQSALGLTPYSALLGALTVEDEMRIRFRIRARAAATSGRAPPAGPSPGTPCAAPRP